MESEREQKQTSNGKKKSPMAHLYQNWSEK